MKHQYSICTTIILQFFSWSVNAQEVIRLYPDSIPNSIPAPDEEETTYPDGITIISKISRPSMLFFPAPAAAAGKPRTAVIICPGGGYWVEAASHEGTDVAKKLNQLGISAFVLKYRIPNRATMINPAIGPLQDAQQAIRMVRLHAAQWNINPDRVGIMGFSAGGHVAATAGTQFKKSFIPNPGNIPLRPDFMLLIYPVISFNRTIGHRGSSDQLIGKTPDSAAIALYSAELQVTPQTPPCFLVHAADDTGVTPENSIVFFQALQRQKVPAELHIYQSGGHGFGLYIKNSRDYWMDRCANWLRMNGWLQ